MYEDLKIAYYQMDIVWGNKQQNFSDIEREMAEHKDEGVDLLVLPEVFATGFKSKNIADFCPFIIFCIFQNFLKKCVFVS